MRASNFTRTKATLTFIAATLMISGCVKPQNHDTAIDANATFFVDEVKASMQTAATYEGYTLPKTRLFTFTACIHDRRTSDSLPGAPFTISGAVGGPISVSTDKDGCAIWAETIAFDILAPEHYISTTRTLTAKGTQSGARTVKLALDPWNLNSKSAPLKDLDHTSVPESQLASSVILKTRPIQIATLLYKNSSTQTADGASARRLKVYLDPSVSLSDIEGAQQNLQIQVQSGKLQVEASLIESTTTGGQETRTVISQTEKPVAVFNDNGKTSADLPLKLSKGTIGSRYFLALKVTPVDGPKNLSAFEGLFTLGDLKSMSEEGSSSADLTASNNDQTFAYSDVLKDSHALRSGPQTALTNGGDGSNLKTFAISQLQPTWGGVTSHDVSNTRTILYKVQACINDFSNGGRPAAGVEFSIQLSDKTWVKRTTSNLNGMEGCLVWEDQITHLYYAQERYTLLPVTIKHKSGYSETRQIAIDPWQSYRFFADPATQMDLINTVNGKAALPNVLSADGIEFNVSQAAPRYTIDDFMAISYVKRVALKIPLRVTRASNVVDGINAAPEPLRQGKYLLKAAFVTPLAGNGVDETHLLISPMIGLNRVVEVRNGALYADVDFAVADVRLLNARSWLAFEVKLLDEDRLPSNNKLLNQPFIDGSSYLDTRSSLITPTFAGVLNLKNEKDASGILWKTTELAGSMPMTDSINSISSRAQTNSDLTELASPLANMTVDVLYARAKQDETAYRQRMLIQKSVGAAALRANTEVVFLNNEKYNSLDDKVLNINNRVLPNVHQASDSLLRLLNTPLKTYGSALQTVPKITKESVSRLLSGQQSFDSQIATQLCGYFFYTLPRTKVTGLAWNVVELGRSGNWIDACVKQVASHGPNAAFSIDHFARVLRSNKVEQVAGRQTLMHSGATTAFAQQKTASWSGGFGFGTSGLMGELSKRALLSRDGNPLLKIFTSAVGVAGIGAEISRSVSDAASTANGWNFELGQNLAVDENVLRINVTESDDCLIIRPQAQMLTSLHMTLFSRQTKEAPQVMARGLMICGGRVLTQNRSVIEHYYTIGYNLSLVGANTLDAMNIESLPWIFSMRGQRDYAAFLAITSSQSLTPAGIGEQFDLLKLPSERLQDFFDQTYSSQGKVSAIPGFIRLEPTYIWKRTK